jgi:DNA-binding PadR family transcriptional regulator
VADLKAQVYASLRKKPGYGYDIARTLNVHRVLVYRVLAALEKEGAVVSVWEQVSFRRKVFSVKEAV